MPPGSCSYGRITTELDGAGALHSNRGAVRCACADLGKELLLERLTTMEAEKAALENDYRRLQNDHYRLQEELTALKRMAGLRWLQPRVRLLRSGSEHAGAT
jgi:hypothetical protein